MTQGTGTFQPPEFPAPFGPEGAATAPGTARVSPVNRRQSKPSSEGEAVTSTAVAGPAEAAAAATLGVSFDGLNHRDQRTANGGNRSPRSRPTRACASATAS